MIAHWAKKRHVHFYGGFGYGNLGDDAALEGLRAVIASKIVPVSPLNEQDWKTSVPEVLLVGGGGVLLNDGPLLPKADGLKKCACKVLFSAGLNCDYGDEFLPKARREIHDFVASCKRVTVRDEVSRGFLWAEGMKDVTLLPDLSLFLEPVPSRMLFRQRNKVLGVNLAFHRPQLAANREAIMGVFQNALSSLQEDGWDIVFLPCQARPEWTQDDREPSWRLQEALSTKTAIGVVQRQLKAREHMGFLQENVDVMLGVRLHASILAAASGVPIIGTGYNVKHDGFFELIGMTNSLLNVFKTSAEEIVSLVKAAWEDRESIKRQLHERRASLLEQARIELEETGKMVFA